MPFLPQSRGPRGAWARGTLGSRATRPQSRHPLPNQLLCSQLPALSRGREGSSEDASPSSGPGLELWAPDSRKSEGQGGPAPLLASSPWRLRVAFSLSSGLQHPTRPHHLCLPSDQAPGSSQDTETRPQHSTSSSARGRPHTPASTRPAPTCSVLLPDI